MLVLVFQGAKLQIFYDITKPWKDKGFQNMDIVRMTRFNGQRNNASRFIKTVNLMHLGKYWHIICNLSLQICYNIVIALMKQPVYGTRPTTATHQLIIEKSEI